jgi:integral membrane protein
MSSYLNTNIGRLRLISFLEGISLLLLLFIAMPLKYIFDLPMMTAIIGALHGGLFLIFGLIALYVSLTEEWNFWKTTWKVLLSCIIPFGTFYVDAKILKPMQVAEDEAK